jgi:hypothetical protein
MSSRLRAFGNQLVDYHQRLREQLEALREDPDAVGEDLTTHCLSFCSALTRHHTVRTTGRSPSSRRRTRSSARCSKSSPATTS